MKVIIIILQAILNLVRKRRDLIANRSKIPPEYRDDVVVWYSPKKQRLTNYDVIESYAEDFTYWTLGNTGITSTPKKIVIPTGTELKYIIAYRGFNSSTDGFDIKYTGNVVITYKYNKEDDTVGTIAIDKSGIYHLPASVRVQKNFGFYCNPQTVTEEATIEQLPTSILKDFSGNGLDAYMYGFQGKLNSGVGIYSAMRNGFDVINANANKNAFDLYKYSRDNKDELMGQIGEMKTELAVLKATRPYQDAIIQCDIRRVAEHADFNLWRRTCRMISGEVVLPNTPTVTGYASYNPCACPATTPAPTTAA